MQTTMKLVVLGSRKMRCTSSNDSLKLSRLLLLGSSAAPVASEATLRLMLLVTELSFCCRASILPTEVSRKSGSDSSRSVWPAGWQQDSGVGAGGREMGSREGRPRGSSCATCERTCRSRVEDYPRKLAELGILRRRQGWEYSKAGTMQQPHTQNREHEAASP